MSGNYSRNKGMRNEYLLRDSLRAEGYVADRVPASGAAQGFKGDVRFVKNGNVWLAELKVRAAAFKRIYALYAQYKMGSDCAVAIETPEGLTLVSISDTMDLCLGAQKVYFPESYFATKDGYRTHKPGFRKLLKLRELLGEAHVLVIKDDRKPFLYLRYQ